MRYREARIYARDIEPGDVIRKFRVRSRHLANDEPWHPPVKIMPPIGPKQKWARPIFKGGSTYGWDKDSTVYIRLEIADAES